MMPYRFLPHDRRQWAGAGLFIMAAVFATWQASLFSYNQNLKQIEEREWQFWSRVANEARSAIIVVNADTGKITGWNSGAEEMLGWQAKEVVGSQWMFLVPTEYIQAKYGNLETYMERAMDEDIHEELLGTVKVITNCKVNTKGGLRKDCRVTVRTIGSRQHFYVVQIDTIDNVYEVTPDIEVAERPIDQPQPTPMPMPMPEIEQTQHDKVIRERR